MEASTPQVPAVQSDDARLASLGYQPQLNRVLGLFANFSVAFTYLSPMVGIYSLFVLGVGTGGPAYVWLTWIPVIGMLFVALVFGELASHYPVAGALYQYSKFSVGPAYGWFVGWFYGIALLITVAAVDTGVVTLRRGARAQLVRLEPRPADHTTILVITLVLLAIQTTLNITGREGDGPRRAVRRRTSRSSARSASRSSWPSTASTTGSGSCSPRRASSTRRRTRSASTSAAAGDRRGADRGARAGLHLLRLRVGRGHLRGDQGRRPAGAAGDALGADLGRRHVVHPDRGPAARDAGATTR